MANASIYETGPMKVVPIRMENKMAERIKILAQADERDFSSYVRMILRRHLEMTTRQTSRSSSVAQKGTK